MSLNLSSFSVAIHGSLRVGLLAKRSLTIEFPRQVFTFLFKDKGTNVQGKPGKLYERSDFLCHYFIFLTTLRMAMVALFLFQYICIVM